MLERQRLTNHHSHVPSPPKCVRQCMHNFTFDYFVFHPFHLYRNLRYLLVKGVVYGEEYYSLSENLRNRKVLRLCEGEMKWNLGVLPLRHSACTQYFTSPLHPQCGYSIPSHNFRTLARGTNRFFVQENYATDRFCCTSLYNACTERRRMFANVERHANKTGWHCPHISRGM